MILTEGDSMYMKSVRNRFEIGPKSFREALEGGVLSGAGPEEEETAQRPYGSPPPPPPAPTGDHTSLTRDGEIGSQVLRVLVATRS